MTSYDFANSLKKILAFLLKLPKVAIKGNDHGGCIAFCESCIAFCKIRTLRN